MIAGQGEVLPEPGGERDDPRRPRGVQGGGLVVGRVIRLVRAGEEVQHGDARGVEAGLIGGAVTVAPPA